jgi:hypothetical protein
MIRALICRFLVAMSFRDPQMSESVACSQIQDTAAHVCYDDSNIPG